MTPARVRACSRLASRAIKRGASAAWGSNTLRFTTMMVSILGGGACARGRGTEHVWDVLSQVPHVFQIQRERDRVLVSFADGGVKVVSRQAHVVAAVRRVDRHPNQRERGVRLHDQAAVPFPAGAALEAQGVVEARYTIAGEAD